MTNNKNKEIERKFLVDKSWIPKSKGTEIIQCYLSDKPTVRIRIADDVAFVTIKGPVKNITRSEYEYEIPFEDAKSMMKLAILPIIEKTRYDEIVDGLHWVIDVFHGKNDGLIVAEIEMESEEQEITLPDWANADVSDQKKYYNSNLAEKPYKNWKQ